MHIDIPKGTIIKGIELLNHKDLILKRDIKIPIKVKLSYEVDNNELNLYKCDDNLESLMKEILLSLRCNYNFYGKYDDEELLTEGALDLKNKMLEILEEVGD